MARVILKSPAGFDIEGWRDLAVMVAKNNCARVEGDNTADKFYNGDTCILESLYKDSDSEFYGVKFCGIDIELMEAFDYLSRFCPQVAVYFDGDAADEYIDFSESQGAKWYGMLDIHDAAIRSLHSEKAHNFRKKVSLIA